MLRFPLIFLAFLSLGLVALTRPEVKVVFSESWGELLAWISHGILSLWDATAIRQANMPFDPATSFGVSVDAECNGIDTVMILWAAMLAFPAGWKQKAMGLVIGFLGLQMLNLLRIISLYYLGQWDRTVFTWSHHNLWQGLMILGALLLFFFRLGLLRDPTREISDRETGSA